MNKNKLTKELLLEYRKVAYYYYISNITQDDIAKKMGMSRQRVNRILGHCTEYGIVKFSIEGLQEDNLEVELLLEKKYNLKGAHIVTNVDSEKIHVDLGKGAAEFLNKMVVDNDIIGFSRGRSISKLVDNLTQTSAKNLTVTQLFGNEPSSTSEAKIDELVFYASKTLNAQTKLIYAPVLVKDKSLKDSMMKEPLFLDSYSIIKNCTIAFSGIGTKDSQIQHVQNAYGEEKLYDMEWQKEIVGEVCTYYYDSKGKIVKTPFDDRLIRILIDDYLTIPLRVGVAGQPEKVASIKAAIEGNLINALVTDLETAQSLLKED